LSAPGSAGARLARWYRANQLPIQLVALILLLLVLYLVPSIFVSIGPGQAAVKWRRFGFFGLFGVARGTVVDHTYGEGVQAKLPWDRFYIYDVRLRQQTDRLAALTSDGLPLEVEVTTIFRPLVSRLGELHKHVGPRYEKVLVAPEVGAALRDELATLSSGELYSARRTQVEDEILRRLVGRLDVRYAPREAVFAGNDAAVRLRLLEGLASRPQGETVDEIAAVLSGPAAASRAQICADLADLEDEDLVRRIEPRAHPCDGGSRYGLNHRTLGGAPDLRRLVGYGGPLVYVEDVAVRRIDLPADLTHAIEAKLVQQQELQSYDFRIAKEQKEKERKGIEAQGIRLFQDTVGGPIMDSYLKWKGIDATLELARSPNGKIVVIGGGSGGLPIVLGALDTTAAGATATGALASPRPPSPPAAAPGSAPPPRPPGGAGAPP
jgi:regulator of protease activity HflC (stomatin/prohibitin superfamily)